MMEIYFDRIASTEDEALPVAALNHRWPWQAWGPWVDEAGGLLKGTGPGCIHWWPLTAGALGTQSDARGLAHGEMGDSQALFGPSIQPVDKYSINVDLPSWAVRLMQCKASLPFKGFHLGS